MTSNQSYTTHLRVTAVVLLLCLPLVALIAFRRGEVRGIQKAQVSSANDSAFYCLSGLRAINGEKKLKLLLQISLDGEAIRLSQLCIEHPQWIGRTNYNLLKSIGRYLSDHPAEREGLTSLRPVTQIASKVSEAIAKLEELHDAGEWRDE